MPVRQAHEVFGAVVRLECSYWILESHARVAEQDQWLCEGNVVAAFDGLGLGDPVFCLDGDVGELAALQLFAEAGFQFGRGDDNAVGGARAEDQESACGNQ